LRVLRRRIAVKLTLTLVAFVGVSMLAAGFYLGDALERAAVVSLEARLATSARLLHDDAEALLRGRAAPAELYLWATRAAAAAGTRGTLITPDGVVIADSLVA